MSAAETSLVVETFHSLRHTGWLSIPASGSVVQELFSATIPDITLSKSSSRFFFMGNVCYKNYISRQIAFETRRGSVVVSSISAQRNRRWRFGNTVIVAALKKIADANIPLHVLFKNNMEPEVEKLVDDIATVTSVNHSDFLRFVKDEFLDENARKYLIDVWRFGQVPESRGTFHVAVAPGMEDVATKLEFALGSGTKELVNESTQLKGFTFESTVVGSDFFSSFDLMGMNTVSCSNIKITMTCGQLQIFPFEYLNDNIPRAAPDLFVQVLGSEVSFQMHKAVLCQLERFKHGFAGRRLCLIFEGDSFFEAGSAFYGLIYWLYHKQLVPIPAFVEPFGVVQVPTNALCRIPRRVRDLMNMAVLFQCYSLHNVLADLLNLRMFFKKSELNALQFFPNPLLNPTTRPKLKYELPPTSSQNLKVLLW